MGEREREEVVIDGKDCFQTRTRKKIQEEEEEEETNQDDDYWCCSNVTFHGGSIEKGECFCPKKKPLLPLSFHSENCMILSNY